MHIHCHSDGIIIISDMTYRILVGTSDNNVGFSRFLGYDITFGINLSNIGIA